MHSATRPQDASDTARITLAHGNGGRRMRELIEDVFGRHLGGPHLDLQADAVRVLLASPHAMVTTDGFTVQPLEFPGGDIGSLAVHGTVNDLAVAGAIPRALCLSALIEEGLELACLDRIVRSLACAARTSGVAVVAGDTKVVPRGQGGGLYLVTTGIGEGRPESSLGLGRIQVGDAILVSGPVGDHAVAVLLAREAFELRGDVRSDAACVLPLTTPLLDLPGLRFMRDPTRGGLASVAHEIARATGFGIRLQEAAIPVRDPVRSVCEMLGYDPYYLACEGRVVAVVAETDAGRVLDAWARAGADAAALVGRVERAPARVVLETEIGGLRVLEELEDDPLPRIC